MSANERTWYEYLQSDWKAADDCLKDIIQIARKDLKT